MARGLEAGGAEQRSTGDPTSCFFPCIMQDARSWAHRNAPLHNRPGACRGAKPLCVYSLPPLPKGDQGGLARNERGYRSPRLC